VSVGTMDQNRRFVEELVEHLGLQARLSA
jgi:hypothetical protein